MSTRSKYLIMIDLHKAIMQYKSARTRFSNYPTSGNNAYLRHAITDLVYLTRSAVSGLTERGEWGWMQAYKVATK